MAVIELADGLFYRGGQAFNTQVVGIEWVSGQAIRRVARYTFTAPSEGANKVKITFHTGGLSGGNSHIPILFFIGTDPDSHANAGATYEYTGELTMESDGITFTAEADVLLLPGKTYYLWVFPGNDELNGYYYWARYTFTQTLETEGSACVLPIFRGGSWWLGLVYCKYKGSLWLCACYVCRGGKWYLCGAP